MEATLQQLFWRPLPSQFPYSPPLCLLPISSFKQLYLHAIFRLSSHSITIPSVPQTQDVDLKEIPRIAQAICFNYRQYLLNHRRFEQMEEVSNELGRVIRTAALFGIEHSDNLEVIQLLSGMKMFTQERYPYERFPLYSSCIFQAGIY